MRTRSIVSSIVALPLTGAVLMACERERPPMVRDDSEVRARHVELQPGLPGTKVEISNPYEGNMQALAEGQQLYNWFNCSGCHFNGGGGIGPPLMDDDWIYGSAPANVFASITEGRPEGMPAYGGHIPHDQVWKIVAYVRSLSGIAPQLSAGARSDALQETPGKHLEDAPEELRKQLKEAN